MGTIPAPIPRTHFHHGWLLIYNGTMQSLMSILRTAKIAVVSKFMLLSRLSKAVLVPYKMILLNIEYVV